MQLLFLVLVVVALLAAAMAQSPKYKQTREMEEKVKNLDPMTKRRVMAMHAAGMPHDAIAEKIQYLAGNNPKQASRLVHGIKLEDAKNKRK